VEAPPTTGPEGVSIARQCRFDAGQHDGSVVPAAGSLSRRSKRYRMKNAVIYSYESKGVKGSRVSHDCHQSRCKGSGLVRPFIPCTISRWGRTLS
jgi:hypothetical protein